MQDIESKNDKSSYVLKLCPVYLSYVFSNIHICPCMTFFIYIIGVKKIKKKKLK